MRTVQISVNVDIPALSAFVDYLLGKEQKTIDSIAVKVDVATSSVGQLSAGLKAAVDTNK